MCNNYNRKIGKSSRLSSTMKNTDRASQNEEIKCIKLE